MNDAALTATQQAAEIRVRTGDRGGVAQTLNVLAAIVFERGLGERRDLFVFADHDALWGQIAMRSGGMLHGLVPRGGSGRRCGRPG